MNRQAWVFNGIKPGHFKSDLIDANELSVVEFSTPVKSDRVYVSRVITEVVLAKDLSASYSTKRLAGPAYGAPSYSFQIDLDGLLNTTGDRKSLIFEPRYNYSLDNVDYSDWNEWQISPMSQFWSVGGKRPGGTFAQAIAGKEATARIISVQINQGTENTGWRTLLDTVRFGDTIYNFEQNDGPILESPTMNSLLSSGATNRLQAWSGVQGATKYRYQSYSSNPIENPTASALYTEELTSLNRTISPDTTDGTYYWRIQAIEPFTSKWSEVRSFTIDTTAPDAPIFEVTDVADNDTTKTTEVAATWAKPSADTISYNLRYWTNNPNSPWQETTPNLISTADVAWNGTLEGGDGQYFFQVQAIDRAGNESAWSAVYIITLDTTIPVEEDRPTPVTNPDPVTPPPAEPEVATPLLEEPAPVSTPAPSSPIVAQNNIPAPEDVETPEVGAPNATPPTGSVDGGETNDAQEIKGTSDDNPAAALWGWLAAAGIILSGWWAAATFNSRRNKRQGL